MPSDEELPARLRGVLRVVYLIFNEGYSASAGDQLVRGELCAEAIRLGQLLCELLPAEAEAWGLLALMLLHDARRAARSDADGGYVALTDQDRSLWDRALISEGLRALSGPSGSGVPASTSSRRPSRRCTSRRPTPPRPTGRRSRTSTAPLAG